MQYPLPFRLPLVLMLALIAALMLWSPGLEAHAITLGDKGYVQEVTGVHIIPFMYLGAKHMVTGYDHILFLLGVVFFLYGIRQIALYVTLFAVGHSLTMLVGVWFKFGINPYLIDAIIGFSVLYKALDNLGAWRLWFGVQPDTRVATAAFWVAAWVRSGLENFGLRHITRRSAG